MVYGRKRWFLYPIEKTPPGGKAYIVDKVYGQRLTKVLFRPNMRAFDKINLNPASDI